MTKKQSIHFGASKTNSGASKMVVENATSETLSPAFIEASPETVEEALPQNEKALPQSKKTPSSEIGLKLTKEINGPKGLEPTRYGDWESKGRCHDF